MPRLRSVLAALALVAGGCATTTTIGIDPGEQFVLGGGQAGAFEARLVNQGRVTVGVAELTAAGDTVYVADLAPGEATAATFAVGSAALLINRSTGGAVVRGRIRGSGLGMRYVPVDG